MRMEPIRLFMDDITIRLLVIRFISINSAYFIELTDLDYDVKMLKLKSSYKW